MRTLNDHYNKYSLRTCIYLPTGRVAGLTLTARTDEAHSDRAFTAIKQDSLAAPFPFPSFPDNVEPPSLTVAIYRTLRPWKCGLLPLPIFCVRTSQAG